MHKYTKRLHFPQSPYLLRLRGLLLFVCGVHQRELLRALQQFLLVELFLDLLHGLLLLLLRLLLGLAALLAGLLLFALFAALGLLLLAALPLAFLLERHPERQGHFRVHIGVHCELLAPGAGVLSDLPGAAHHRGADELIADQIDALLDVEEVGVVVVVHLFDELLQLQHVALLQLAQVDDVDCHVVLFELFGERIQVLFVLRNRRGHEGHHALLLGLVHAVFQRELGDQKRVGEAHCAAQLDAVHGGHDFGLLVRGRAEDFHLLAGHCDEAHGTLHVHLLLGGGHQRGRVVLGLPARGQVVAVARVLGVVEQDHSSF